ncbi:MAG TPA: acetyl-CoA carboxylase biotin carboxyl carrier protein [Kiritimatiellia bacterium]|nr:acetyl-CoA carboxylase biotin carboxyl carrier protein [Kiritimatiellia bacterium]HMO97947.1 acetyl-CoA carboxylase biotin carboxyl carrier protein [Kiritimatiellia bacterium]HMP95298.1 acetyl-CoA carboxylase biotin carboxyl carrier protein [Kiritimatiellia bacterium]
MDIKEIKKIIELMKENELSEFELAEEGFRITVRRPYAGAAPQVMMGQAPGPYYPSFAPAPAVAGGAPSAPAAPAKEELPSNLIEIKSPMVGTFYRSASPEAEPYAAVGGTVEAESVVCIIEAMKVMNEIKAEVCGTIRKILVENATAVEYGQPLFLVEPK